MDQKREQEVRAQVRQYLLQISLELEASAAAAKAAAEAIPNRQMALPYMQQLYSRLNEATYLLDRFKNTIDDALMNGK